MGANCCKSAPPEIEEKTEQYVHHHDPNKQPARGAMKRQSDQKVNQQVKFPSKIMDDQNGEEEPSFVHENKANPQDVDLEDLLQSQATPVSHHSNNDNDKAFYGEQSDGGSQVGEAKNFLDAL